jgi:hypothetical protein
MKIAAAVATSVVVLATASQAAAAGGQPSGTYVKLLPASGLPSPVPNLLLDLSFGPGTYSVTLAGLSLNAGTTIDTSSTVTFQEPNALDGCTTPGTYRYDVDGSKLSFELVSDPSPFCFARVVALTLGPWHQVS